MNERIKQLSDIAYKNHLANNPHSSFGRRTDYDKEFAELIVRECAGVILEEMKKTPQVHSYWGPFYDGLDSAQKMINKHFGVEE